MIAHIEVPSLSVLWQRFEDQATKNRLKRQAQSSTRKAEGENKSPPYTAGAHSAPSAGGPALKRPRVLVTSGLAVGMAVVLACVAVAFVKFSGYDLLGGSDAQR